MLAAVACGEYAGVAEAAERLVRVTQTISPDPEIAARYDQQYRRFRAVCPAVKEPFPVLNG